jgi:hypothetical protein
MYHVFDPKILHAQGQLQIFIKNRLKIAPNSFPILHMGSLTIHNMNNITQQSLDQDLGVISSIDLVLSI